MHVLYAPYMTISMELVEYQRVNLIYFNILWAEDGMFKKVFILKCITMLRIRINLLYEIRCLRDTDHVLREGKGMVQWQVLPMAYI